MTELKKEEMEALKSALTYPNPAYAQATRLNFSTRNIPKNICTYKVVDDSTIVAHRGEVRTIVEALSRFSKPKIETSEDKPLVGYRISYENKTFALDPRQERVITDITDSHAKQGIVHAATSAGKSAIIMALIAKLNTPTLVIVHSKILLTQLQNDAREWLRLYDAQDRCVTTANSVPLIGTVGDGRMEVGVVTFAIDKSLKKLLANNPTLCAEFGLVVVDECHKAPTSTFIGLLSVLHAPYRFGFTGTLKRKDGLGFLINAAFGRVISTITVGELMDAGRITPVETVVHNTNIPTPEIPETAQANTVWRLVEEHLHNNEDRLMQARDIALKVLTKNPASCVVIVSRFVEPAKRLAALLTEAGFPCPTITGKDTDNVKTCRSLRMGEIRVATATLGCFATGVNIPELTDIVLISPCFTNELLLHQLRGRLMRVSPNKETATLHFLFDNHVFPAYKLTNFLRTMRK